MLIEILTITFNRHKLKYKKKPLSWGKKIFGNVICNMPASMLCSCKIHWGQYGFRCTECQSCSVIWNPQYTSSPSNSVEPLVNPPNGGGHWSLLCQCLHHVIFSIKENCQHSVLPISSLFIFHICQDYPGYLTAVTTALMWWHLSDMKWCSITNQYNSQKRLSAPHTSALCDNIVACPLSHGLRGPYNHRAIRQLCDPVWPLE